LIRCRNYWLPATGYRLPPNMPHSCVIFDFDGVIADSERLHLAAYNHAFAQHVKEIGGPLLISPQAYFTKYIVYGNHQGFRNMLRDADRPQDEPLITALCDTKDRLFEDKLHEF